MKKLDVAISGQMGFYIITPLTPKARKWTGTNLNHKLGSAIACESGSRCREIVAGMVASKLKVEVNGVDMKGFKASA